MFASSRLTSWLLNWWDIADQVYYHESCRRHLLDFTSTVANAGFLRAVYVPRLVSRPLPRSSDGV
jgi:hypothetical protein